MFLSKPESRMPARLAAALGALLLTISAGNVSSSEYPLTPVAMPVGAFALQAPSLAPDAPREYVVQKGDTLWAVSKKAYGNGAKYMKIFEANRPMLSDPDKIYPGQVLRIPMFVD